MGRVRTNGARTATGTTPATVDPRLFWLIVARGLDLDLRKRSKSGPALWRLRCPVNGAHDVTLVNGQPGLALTCHGARGDDSPGHAATVHQRIHAEGWDPYDPAQLRYLFLDGQAWPCRWCGCTVAEVLEAFGARARDRFRQDISEATSCTRCGCAAYKVQRYTLCLIHLAEAVGVGRVLWSDE